MPTTRKFMLCTGEFVHAEQLANYPSSHIIGELRYVANESRKVVSLAYYEDSRCIQDMPTELPPLRIESIIGDTRGIKCTYPQCSQSNRWVAGRAAIESIVERARRSNFVLESKNG